MNLKFTKRSHTAFSENSLLEKCAMTCPEARDSNPAGVRESNRVSKLYKAFGLVAVMVMGASMSSCNDDDEREPVLPPVIEATPNTLAGVITDIAGTPVSGAKVTIGNLSATTDANGTYSIPNVAKGSYQVTAEANGMYPVSSNVNFTQANEQNLLWSVALNQKVTQDLVIEDPDAEATGDVTSENIPDNEEGAVTITVDVPANTVPRNTTISIAPIYSVEAAIGSRAGESETMLIGANVTCSDPNLALTAPIDVTFALDSSIATEVTAKEFDTVSNTWREVKPQIDGNGNVVIKTTKFTSFGLFLPISVTTVASSEEIQFTQSLYDNRNGSGNMFVEAASFTYKAGTAINAEAKNKLQGLLIEHLARLFGVKVTTLTGSYPLGINLAIGQGILLKGTQAVDAVSVSSNRTTVTGTRYGNVTVTASAFSVDHNGGIVGSE